MCISPRRNAISASNKFRHVQLSAPSFLHLFGHRGFRQVFVRVDESPLPHLAIKNQVRTPGMQTLWHEFFAGRPCGIYCACVRFELFSVSCDILPPPHHQRSIKNLSKFTRTLTCPTPPHPTPPHHQRKHQEPQQVHTNVNMPHPTPPHPTPSSA